MSEFFLAPFIEIDDASGTRLHSWQCSWLNQSGSGYSFMPFDISSLLDATGGEFADVTLTLPLTTATLSLAENGIANQYRCLISLYQYGTLPVAPATGTLVASFYGRLIGATASETGITLSVGNRLDAVEGQMPARLYTAALVGQPPKV